MCAHTPYLSRDVCKLDVLLEVTHQHEVPCLDPAVMYGMMVDVAEDGSNTYPNG